MSTVPEWWGRECARRVHEQYLHWEVNCLVRHVEKQWLVDILLRNDLFRSLSIRVCRVGAIVSGVYCVIVPQIIPTAQTFTAHVRVVVFVSCDKQMQSSLPYCE